MACYILLCYNKIWNNDMDRWRIMIRNSKIIATIGDATDKVLRK